MNTITTSTVTTSTVTVTAIGSLSMPLWADVPPLQRQLVQEILVEGLHRHIRREQIAESYGDIPLVADLARSAASGFRIALKHLGLNYSWGGGPQPELPSWESTPAEVTEIVLASLLEAAERWGKSYQFAVKIGLMERASRVAAVQGACCAAAVALGYQSPVAVYVDPKGA